MMSKEQKFGLQGEIWALEQLLERGYQARLVSNFFADVDIMLEGCLPVEVKTAIAKRHYAGHCWRYRWQFDVSRLPKWADSLVILVALDGGKRYPFIIPSWLVGLRHNVHLTSHPEAYRGYFKQFLNEWGFIEQALSIRARHVGQMILPLEVQEYNQ